uniref:Uncharacterized protein n=1 Tax=Rhizophagus irregularis (strain DAOM 181602 / DAOM 197198 / MUCL 43194) TaxID=747089 RepID=U9SKE6_RHIID
MMTILKSDTHNKLLLLRWFNENISLKDIKQSQKCSYESKRHKRHQEIRDNNNQALDDSTKYFGSAIKRLELIKRRMGRSDKKRPVSEKIVADIMYKLRYVPILYIFKKKFYEKSFRKVCLIC